MKWTSMIAAVVATAIALSVPAIALAQTNSPIFRNTDLTDTVTPSHHGGHGGTHHGGHGGYGGCW
ncbi:hypothetical protein IQ254_00150 [Nodosilinea sp. LEGE 07088]|uniref:hypothetical protein n=1 Tax=Nodosilinea sp. LEGE 07088 TaxID=2777968 RepID=UPI00187F4045|nr:hypothetical protein [Nodosilinea sp. LEGE 07088]MBE9135632.1 hypothetical protein [Nodosilinea sp. LEGE 07088]